MAKKYKFDWAEEDAVECQELDAFIAELDAVCEKHGAGFVVERGYDGDPTDLLIVPYEQADMSIFTDDLNDYGGGVPWLDRAQAAHKKKREARHMRQQSQEQKEREAAKGAREQALLREGVVVQGKRYKLVAE